MVDFNQMWLLLGQKENCDWWYLCAYCHEDDVKADIKLYRENGDDKFCRVVFMVVTKEDMTEVTQVERMSGFTYARLERAAAFTIDGIPLRLSEATTDTLNCVFDDRETSRSIVIECKMIDTYIG